jgi:glycyl-tRNA synthetase beta chain
MAEFLLEIGLEEIPARMIAAAETELATRVQALLTRQRLLASEGVVVSSYSTPRRLAVRVQGVLAQQLDMQEQLTGPSWKAAFPGGNPGPAAEAFAKKAGVPVEALVKITTPKGEYAGATVQRPGQTAEKVLSEGLAQEIGALTWPKTMYWRLNKPERFVRPLRWLLCLLDEAVVPLEFAGIHAGRVSYGHRVLHGETPVEIAKPADYLGALERAFVLADVAVRRQKIRKALDAVTRTLPEARWREDEPLVEQVTHLTEWPSVLLGNFQADYLSLPEEVLVTVMRDHQKYFAVEDKQHALAPHFLAVLNTAVDDPSIIRHGNERVLRARFNDARFFWNYDQKIPLEQRLDKLKTVTFQRDLGSYAAKTESNLLLAKAIAWSLAAQGIPLDHPALEQAVRLAKTDLTTELVKEFTELQGIVGGLYARAQGLGEKVSQAIYAQYLPAGMEDTIPATIEGQVLGLADRMATLAEMFAIGLAPTGSKDPFALRRAANGVVKILAESGLPLTLAALEAMAVEALPRVQAAKGSNTLAVFMQERLDFYLRDVRGYAYDVVNAVLSAGLTTVTDAIARAEALTKVRGSDDLLAISTAFKRIKNILRQAAEKQDKQGETIVNADLVEPAEQQLHANMVRVAPDVETLRANQQYLEALERIATLRPAIDGFFDKVMVMAPEPNLRQNRLALIAAVLSDFSRIADFSEIVPG